MEIDKNELSLMSHQRKTRLGWLKASCSVGVPLVPDVP
ncbi:hypothetical protein LLB_1978 [Legionella longbeachae D-4968]|nr:hypothetical protein LLB_1978 [Legionella longbeachae D-4968]